MQVTQIKRRRKVSNVLLVGDHDHVSGLSSEFEAASGVNVVGCVNATEAGPGQDRHLGHLSDMGRVAKDQKVDHVLVALSRFRSHDFVEAARFMQGKRSSVVPRFSVVPSVFVVIPNSSSAVSAMDPAGVERATPATSGWRSVIKRGIDIVGAIALMIVLSPVLVAIAIGVRLGSPGPIFFRQSRIGLHGNEFPMLKFRSMYHGGAVRPGAEGESCVGPFPKLKDDPRVTPIGRFIRKYSLDELPQLVNVLRGQMSLVGPRPFIPADAEIIKGWATGRQAVRPGITGLWQVSGRNELTFDDMCRLDHLYVNCWSIGLDLRILVRTITAVAQRHGAY